MAKNKWSLEDSYDLVLRRNASIAPNFHFMGQLTEYERHLGVRGASVGVSFSKGRYLKAVTSLTFSVLFRFCFSLKFLSFYEGRKNAAYFDPLFFEFCLKYCSFKIALSNCDVLY
ncbi:hypothetical protein OESDEN_06887 [Oesophagostomum dentatum]|uniref:Uncharacterized protein n=1 Tax=Oesophagostomum dentatum TaxID=61180 RepID=A0A0B1T7K5_OESDE|nr:hypothetical protein OESDEN_06887 [Oesophagostomum dentatum]